MVSFSIKMRNAKRQLLADEAPCTMNHDLLFQLSVGFRAARYTLCSADLGSYYIWVEELDDICQVYETVETMLLNQDEELKITVQSEGTTAAGDMRNHLRKLSIIFAAKINPHPKLLKTLEQ
ncbi:hypothetical protein Salat_2028700 [Sesamum alatum]|uniref:Uncharacterized protein n=1 Tax=Sesamum alatum TaxID=300844 RepID=A0AAE2CG22_9LAMI|nr:hypothetical protein Salat_2028700 [Sesamum alatum]